MHIEKNVCDSVVGTLLNLSGKSKEGLSAREDLREMGIRPTLHPKKLRPGKEFLPPACYTMSPNEKTAFCKVLKRVKVPDGYAANVSRGVHVKERKISGLKSHDCHVLMQQLLPLAVRNILPKDVSSTIIELCEFFRELCSKVSEVKNFEQLESRIALTLCKLERIFPPAFFDVMVHLPIHLASEAKVAGPVHYRWMYPIERFVNKAKFMQYCLSFCFLQILIN